MRKISIVAAVAVAGTIVGFQPVRRLLGMPMGLQSAIQHIKFERRRCRRWLIQCFVCATRMNAAEGRYLA